MNKIIVGSFNHLIQYTINFSLMFNLPLCVSETLSPSPRPPEMEKAYKIALEKLQAGKINNCKKSLKILQKWAKMPKIAQKWQNQ